MRIDRQRLKLVDREACRVLGNVTPLDLDVSLPALIRAITIDKNRDAGVEDWIIKSSLFFGTAYANDDLAILATHYNEAFTIVKTKSSVATLGITEPGWETFDSKPYFLNAYLSTFSNTKVYVNKEKQRVIAIVENPNHTWIQAFESLFGIILSWYYSPGDKEAEAFFKSISVNRKNADTSKAEEAIVDYVNRIASEIDLQSIILHRQLDGVINYARNAKIKEEEDCLTSIRNYIENYTRNLRIKYNELDEHTALLNAMKNSSPGQDDEMFNFFSQNKNISIVRIDNGSDIVYRVVDTLEYYDELEAETLFDNEGSWACNEYNFEDIELFKKLFVEKRGIIKVEAEFSLNNLRLVEPHKRFERTTGMMPNPHIFFYGCSGGHDVYYSQYAESGDWELAIQQSVAATKNWSVGDSSVGNRMFEWLLENHDEQVIYVNDGLSMDGIDETSRLVSLDEFRCIVNDEHEEESEET